MAVSILTYGYPKAQLSQLARFPLDKTLLVGDPQPHAKTVGDLLSDDNLLMMASSRALTAQLRHVNCRVSLVLQEPPAVQRRYYRMMPFIGSRYHQVFTYCDGLLGRLRNAIPLPHGGASINPPSPHETRKTKLISLIASQKRTTEGHRLRHRIAAWSQEFKPELERFGRGYRPVDSVLTALAPFRYSVVIENSRFPGYFTEKLIDCLLCRTIPIYWGDPRVLSRFDAGGILPCGDENELRQCILACSEQDYQGCLLAIEKNYRLALQFAEHPILRAARVCAASATSDQVAFQSLSEKGVDPLRRGPKRNENDSPPKGQTPFSDRLSDIDS